MVSLQLWKALVGGKPLQEKTALIVGVTGQDGAYLSELLLKKAIAYMV